MELVEKSSDNLTIEQVYKLTKQSDKSIQELNAGTCFKMAAYIIYKDVNNSTGEENEVLAMEITDPFEEGAEPYIVSTISETFKREFRSILELADEYGKPFTDLTFKVLKGKTKANRDFVNIGLA